MANRDVFGFGPGVPRSGVTLKRDFHGLTRFCEDKYDPWVFHVCGFDSTVTGEADQRTVLRADGSRERVLIDAEDRIAIAD